LSREKEEPKILCKNGSIVIDNDAISFTLSLPGVIHKRDTITEITFADTTSDSTPSLDSGE
jgi:hypothetical protein